MDKKYLGSKIRQARLAKGFSQEKLSEAIDISPRQMCLIETGNSTPSLETFINIASFLDIDVNDFFNLNAKESEPTRLEIIDIIKSLETKKLPLAREIIESIKKYR